MGLHVNASNDLTATLTALLSTAEATKQEELEIRRETESRIAGLENVRARAYRRHHFIHFLGAATIGSTDIESAVAAQASAIGSRLDWEIEQTADQKELRAALNPIFAAVARASRTHPETDRGAAALIRLLDTFEFWFEKRFGVEFWHLFDRFAPEEPLADA